METKYLEGKNSIRITWHWPVGVEQVYILPQEKLYTLQEYKKFGGYIVKKQPGIFTYKIHPILPEGGSTPTTEPHGEVSFVCKTEIDYLVTKKSGFFELALYSEYDVAEDVFCYAKNDKFIYFFGEKLAAGKPILRIIKADADENLRVFIPEQNSVLYTLNKCDSMRRPLLMKG
ncbi:MAG: hypothetical protein FWF78_06970 [Defluviitaleaceae bacterium]|nr:hypothetical protein [Defluviitaleaceae bacterium]